MCNACSYYKDDSKDRKYSKVPYFTPAEIDKSYELQGIAQLIEKGICIIDNENDIDDSIAIRLAELLLDKNFYGDEKLSFNNMIEEKGFLFIQKSLKSNLRDLPIEQIYKVIATILRSIKRHEIGTRSYLDFIHQFIQV